MLPALTEVLSLVLRSYVQNHTGAYDFSPLLASMGTYAHMAYIQIYISKK